jgi:hypothetical protein
MWEGAFLGELERLEEHGLKIQLWKIPENEIRMRKSWSKKPRGKMNLIITLMF